jgi:hypothetical protein
VAQRGNAPGQVHPDRSGIVPELPCDGGVVEIKEDPKRCYLALPGWQTPYRCEQRGIEPAV